MPRKKGGSGNTDRLVERGFGKTKAAQALTDAGNNFDVALRILERQAEQRAAQEARPVGGKAALPLPPASARSADHDGDGASPAVRQRLHPCITQYKSCQFGAYCRLRHLPGDACIQYFNGCCIYGEACRRRHRVDGVDIREGERPRLSDTFTREDGTRYRVCTATNTGVQVAQVVDPDDLTDGPILQGVVSPLYVPDASDFNLIRGTEPSHTDPVCDMGVGGWSVSPSHGVAGPRPYLDRARKAAAAPPPSRVATVTVVGPAAAAGVGSGAAPVTVAGRRRHPCIAQHGSCKFGSACQHADRDADVCVFFLNGLCRNAEGQCRYRHESDDAHVARLLREPPAAVAEAVSVLAAAKKKKSRLQGGAAAEGGVGPRSGAAGLAANPNVEYLEWGDPADSSSDGGRRPPTAADFFPAGRDDDPSTDESDAYSVNPVAVAAGRDDGAVPDDELATFLGLLEAFPEEDPAFILQALRSAGGDPAAVADYVGRAEEASPEAIDAALSKALTEEEAAEAEGASQSEALLTLCYLFPALEVASIGAVYGTCSRRFDEAYEALMCSQENIVRREFGNVWRGDVSKADQLRLEKLYGMFPEMHPDIVRSTFGASDKDPRRAIAALNTLATELLSLRTRVSMGVESMRWRPHQADKAAVATAATAADAARAAPLAGSEADVTELYRRAAADLREHGDWRRVRERAYLVNTCRLRVLSQASAAFLRGDGALARALSREGSDLGCEYERLNRLAMLALELERLEADPVSALDLHGFHVEEAIEVLHRRIALCRRKRIARLTIILGQGHHSRRGAAALYPAIRAYLTSDPLMAALVRITSVMPAVLETRIALG